MPTVLKSARVTKGGRVQRVYKLNVSKRIGQRKKAERLAKAWKAKSK